MVSELGPLLCRVCNGEKLLAPFPIRILWLTQKTTFYCILPLFRLKVKKPRSVCLNPCSASVGTPYRLFEKSSSQTRQDHQLSRRRLLLRADVTLGLCVSFPGGVRWPECIDSQPLVFLRCVDLASKQQQALGSLRVRNSFLSILLLLVVPCITWKPSVSIPLGRLLQRSLF